MFLIFVESILDKFGFITCVYPDNAEPVLIRGLKRTLAENNLGNISFKSANKKYINDRIFALSLLSAQGRFLYTEETQSLQDAIGTCVWDEKKVKKERLDNGTSDIDSMDAFEYTYERYIKKFLPTFVTTKNEDE